MVKARLSWIAFSVALMLAAPLFVSSGTLNAEGLSAHQVNAFQACTPRYSLTGPDRDCPDFANQTEAQCFYLAAGGPSRDPHRLDSNNNGLACEDSLPPGPPSAPTPRPPAQPACTMFPETGKTVCGRFLAYWREHGGLPQQGFPISEEMQEQSDTDGKMYKVQYFERAVFESHLENPAPNDVLLSLLGNFLYKQKYPGGAPNQEANNTAGSVLFRETGKRVGGKFLAYWQKNGGLAQQGFPISEEFQERSELDGNTYTVQYFERAVFELHPEKQPPFDVLLSQLGTFQYKAKYSATGEAKVEIANIEFNPKELTVAPGTKVTWTQRDTAPHTVVSRSDPKVLNSPFMDKVGDIYSFTFTNPGTYEYWCTVHPEMVAKVIVN